MSDLLHLRYRQKSPFRNFLKLYSAYRFRLIFVVLMYAIKASPTWAMPIITSNIINLLSTHDPEFVSIIIIQASIGLVLILQNIPTHILYVRMFSTISREVEKNLRGALCLRLQQLSIPFHTNNKLGVLQTKILRDVESIEMLFRMLIETVPAICITFTVALTVTMLRAPEFIIFYLITVPVAVILYRLVRKKMIRYNIEFRASIEDMSGKIVEMLKLIPVSRAHNTEQDELEKVNHKLEKVKTSGLKLDLLNGIFGSLNWVVIMFFNLLTLTTAATLSYYKIVPMGVGDVVLLTTYFNSISGSVMQVLGILPNITKGLESVRSIGEVLECPDIERNYGKPRIAEVNGSFFFDNVSFQYEIEDKPAVDEVTLKVSPGETIAFVGPSGSGKSTMMQLIIGFIRPTEGRILIDGSDFEDIDLRSYRKSISVVGQETILFDGSIRDNIVHGVKHVTDEKLREVVASANLEEFVSTLPDGLKTVVKENGERLSGGQKQRIAIARALIRDPRILVLDEATSALDVESEAMIQEALDHLIKGRTTFMVAHRLSTIRDADRIVVMKEGRIVETGNHEELVKLGGIYAKMNKIQSGT